MALQNQMNMLAAGSLADASNMAKAFIYSPKNALILLQGHSGRPCLYYRCVRGITDAEQDLLTQTRSSAQKRPVTSDCVPATRLHVYA